MRRSRRLLTSAIGVLLVIISGACGGSSDPDPETSTSESDSVDAEDIPAVAPTGPPLIEGLPLLELLGPNQSGAGDDPLFSWTAVDGAAMYNQVVLGPDGPIWAWRGTETEIRLGGLPFERPTGIGGPVIVDSTCWSVTALDGETHVIAVSEFVPISPGESSGHVCTPGSGAE